VLNSPGDNLFIRAAGDVDSVAVESEAGGAGLRRPVPRSVSDPLPLWLASVVMNLIGWECKSRMERKTPETDNSTREGSADFGLSL
jgi:hypothetical protein